MGDGLSPGRRGARRRSAMSGARHLPLLLVAALSLGGPAYGEQAAPALELNLDQCIERALQHNASLQAVREETEAARQRTRIAFSEYLPKLEMTARYTWLDEARSFSTELDEQFRDLSLDTAAWWGIAEAAGTGAANAAYDNRAGDPLQIFNRARAQAASQLPAVQEEPILGQNVLEAQILLTQPLFTGGKIREGNRMAQLDEEISRLAVGVRTDEVILQVTNAYLGAVASGRIREELGDLGARLGALRGGTQSALEAGSDRTSARDMAQVDVALATNGRDIAESRRAHELALSALRMLMGLDKAQRLDLAEPESSSPAVPGLEECAASAERRRPEMAQVRTARRLFEHGVARAKASFAPDIAAFGGYHYLTDDEDFANPNDTDEWFAGVSMTLPIFTGFSRTAKVAEARSNLRKVTWQETEVRRVIRLQVEDAYHGVQAALARLAAAEQAVEAATRLKTITTAARAQHIGADYRRMILLSDEPQVLEFKVVPDVPEELSAEIMETQARVARIATDLELGVERARLARAIGVRSLQEAEDGTPT